MLRKKLLVGALLLAGSPLLQAAESWLVTTPRARVVAQSPASRPFLAAARAQQPVDLALHGYDEIELLVRGNANIYEWAAPGSGERVVVRAAEQPYATRMLVRRPQDVGKFSGRVIVELLDASGQHERAPLWALSHEYFLRRGDAWVGVTVAPAAVAALACAAPGNVEAGLAWDALAQIGALLRSSSKENPLLDLNPQRLVAAGYALAGSQLTTFVNAVHARLRLGDGAPIFNAYLNVAGAVAAPLHPCATAQPAWDVRTVLPRDVPFVMVATEADFNREPALRRADSDAEGEVFRRYEIAGAGLPDSPADNLCLEPRSNLPVSLAFHAIWEQLDDLLLRQLPLVSVPLIETTATAVTLDANGNALGGWRLPSLDAPLARYAGRSTVVAGREAAQASCDVTASMQRFPAAKLKALYGNRQEYLRRFHAAVDAAVQARLLVAEDGKALKAAAVRTVPTF